MATDQYNYIDTPLLRFLVESDKAGDLVAVGHSGGFLLVMRERGDEKVLRAQRGGPRLFSRLDTLARYVKELGVYTLTLELKGWDEQ